MKKVKKIFVNFFFIILLLFSKQPRAILADTILNKSYAEYKDNYMIQDILNDGIDGKSVYRIDMNAAAYEGLMTMIGVHKKVLRLLFIKQWDIILHVI